MLTDSSPEPGITSPAIRSPVHPRGTLYHPPSLRGRHHHPHSHSHSHSQSGAQDFRQRDTCADITAYALNIVKSLEIPTDELLEKEEFCRDLEQIIKRLRPSIPCCFLNLYRFQSGIIRELRKYIYNCEFRYRLLRHGSNRNKRRITTIRTPRSITKGIRFPGIRNDVINLDTHSNIENIQTGDGSNSIDLTREDIQVPA